MNAFGFDKALQLIQDQEIVGLRVLDPTGKKLTEWKYDRSEEIVNKLNEYRNEFASYGRIQFICATATVLRANWTGAANWNVTLDFNSIQKKDHDYLYPAPKGFVSPEVASMMAQLEAMKLQMIHNAQMNEYNLKLAEVSNSDPLRYLPILSMFMKIPQENINQAMAMSNISNNMQGKGMAGTQTAENTQKVSVQMEEKEFQSKLDLISTTLTLLIKNVGIEKVEKLIVGINNKPQLVDTALTFL